MMPGSDPESGPGAFTSLKRWGRLPHPFLLVLGACLSLVLLVTSVLLWGAWARQLVPYAVVWGDVATWAQAVAGTLGLGAAALSVIFAARAIERSRQSDIARELAHREQARRSVLLRSRWTPDYSRSSSKPGDRRCFYAYEVVNASSYPISNAKIHIHSAADGPDRYYEDLFSGGTPAMDEVYQAVVIGALAPGERASGVIRIANQNAAHSWWGGEPMANPDFTFTDAWGHHWRRRGNTSVRQPGADLSEEAAQCMCCGSMPDKVSLG